MNVRQFPILTTWILNTCRSSNSSSAGFWWTVNMQQVYRFLPNLFISNCIKNIICSVQLPVLSKQQPQPHVSALWMVIFNAQTQQLELGLFCFMTEDLVRVPNLVTYLLPDKARSRKWKKLDESATLRVACSSLAVLKLWTLNKLSAHLQFSHVKQQQKWVVLVWPS